MDFCSPQDLFQGVQFIRLFIIDGLDPGVDEHLETVDAGGVGDVDRGVLDA